MADSLQLHLLSEGEAYEKLFPLICQTCYRFANKHRIQDVEELIGEAALGFIRAKRTFRPRPQIEGKDFHLGGWVKLIVWQTLSHWLDRQKRSVEASVWDGDGETSGAFVLKELADQASTVLDHLSEDAQTVVRLVLNAPEGLSVRGKKTRSRLAEFLLELGWTGKRIIESFQEITRAIGGL